ncbi:MAG: ABC transporter substrate-binding protein [Proteobacteria bacterium]|nr:ABC transporter substrate-binding protein [Pseudomonadota bacterium]
MARINIMFSRFSAFYSPLISTISAGFLKEEGLEPSHSVATPERTVREALNDGSVHVVQSAVSASWEAMGKGRSSDIVHFAQINERDGFFITGRKADTAFNWVKLIGKKVLADHGRQPLAMFKYAVHKKGLHFDAIDAIDAGGAGDMDAAFRAGEGDYIHQQGPAPQQLEADGVGHVLTSVGKAIGPVAFSSLSATRQWLETDMAGAFMRAYRKARAYVNDMPAAEIARREAQYFEGIDPAVLCTTIEFYQGLGCWNPALAITREAYEVSLDVFLHSGLINKRHAYDDVVVPPPGGEA